MVSVSERPPREQAVWPDARDKEEAVDAIDFVIQDVEQVSDEQRDAANQLVALLKKYRDVLDSNAGLNPDARKSFLKALYVLETIKIAEGVGDPYEQARLLATHYNYALKAGVLVGGAALNGQILNLIHQYQGSDKAAVLAVDAFRLADDNGAGIDNEYREQSVEYRLQLMAEKKDLGTADYYLSSLEKAAAEVYAEQEGVVEFNKKDVPTVVISDLHGRRDFLLKVMETALEWPPASGRRTTVYNLLREDLINVVCVGDVIHIEMNLAPYDEAKKEKDLLESLETMNMVMELVAGFDNFVVVRGNHDDISDPSLQKKSKGELIDQGKYFGDKARVLFGDDFFSRYAEIQALMPLLAISGSDIISHAAPIKTFTRSEIVSRSEIARYGLSCTDNSKEDAKTAHAQGIDDDAKIVNRVKRGAHFNTSEEFILGTAKNLGVTNPRYFCGHRFVEIDERYRVPYANNLLVQTCSADRQLVTVAGAGSEINRPLVGGEVELLGANILAMLNDAETQRRKKDVPEVEIDQKVDEERRTREETLLTEAQRVSEEMQTDFKNVNDLVREYKNNLVLGTEIEPAQLQEHVAQVKIIDQAFTHLANKTGIRGYYERGVPKEIKALIFDNRKEPATGSNVRISYDNLTLALGKKVYGEKKGFISKLSEWTDEQMNFVHQRINPVLTDSAVHLFDRARYSEPGWQQAAKSLNDTALLCYDNRGFFEQGDEQKPVFLLMRARALDTIVHPVIGEKNGGFPRFVASLERRDTFLYDQLQGQHQDAYSKIMHYCAALSPLQAITLLDRLSVLCEQDGSATFAVKIMKTEEMPQAMVSDITQDTNGEYSAFRYRVLHQTANEALGNEGETALVRYTAPEHLSEQMQFLLNLDKVLCPLNQRLRSAIVISQTDSPAQKNEKYRQRNFVIAKALGIVPPEVVYQPLNDNYQISSWNLNYDALITQVLNEGDSLSVNYKLLPQLIKDVTLATETVDLDKGLDDEDNKSADDGEADRRENDLPPQVPPRPAPVAPPQAQRPPEVASPPVPRVEAAPALVLPQGTTVEQFLANKEFFSNLVKAIKKKLSIFELGSLLLNLEDLTKLQTELEGKKNESIAAKARFEQARRTPRQNQQDLDTRYIALVQREIDLVTELQTELPKLPALLKTNKKQVFETMLPDYQNRATILADDYVKIANEIERAPLLVVAAPVSRPESPSRPPEVASPPEAPPQPVETPEQRLAGVRKKMNDLFN